MAKCSRKKKVLVCRACEEELPSNPKAFKFHLQKQCKVYLKKCRRQPVVDHQFADIFHDEYVFRYWCQLCPPKYSGRLKFDGCFGETYDLSRHEFKKHRRFIYKPDPDPACKVCYGHDTDDEPEIFVGAEKFIRNEGDTDAWDWGAIDDEVVEPLKKKKKTPVSHAGDDELAKPKKKKPKTPASDATDDEPVKPKKKKSKTPASDATDDEPVKPKQKKRKTPATDATDDELVKPEVKKKKTLVTSRQWSLQEKALVAAKAAKKAQAAATKRDRKVEGRSHEGHESDREWRERQNPSTPKGKKNAELERRRKSGRIAKPTAKNSKKKLRKKGAHYALSGEKDEDLRTPEPLGMPASLSDSESVAGANVHKYAYPSPRSDCPDCVDVQSAQPRSPCPSPSLISENLRDWRRTDLQPLFHPIAPDVMANLQIIDPKRADALAPAPIAWGQSTYDGHELRGLWYGRFEAARLHAASVFVRLAALEWYRQVEDLYPELYHEYECLAALVPCTGDQKAHEVAMRLLTLPNRELNAVDAARARRLEEQKFGMVATTLYAEGERTRDDKEDDDDDNSEDDDGVWLVHLACAGSPVAPPYSPLDSPVPNLTPRSELADWTPVKTEVPSEGLSPITDSPLMKAFAMEEDDKDGINLIPDEEITDYDFLVKSQRIQAQVV
ncbi:hypothetical protein BDZ88DRAFT_436256 [Geranomyces variabilis]|nr:hypothetical protein BDZ88DRAFT_436256 [Geranomyces variabilis]KAJ3135515.1 hypothetical protein HDU90_003918 [Geranomyces variabilis]